MVNYLVLSIILALLGTVLANPSMYYWIITNRRRIRIALKDWIEDNPEEDANKFYYWRGNNYYLYNNGKCHSSTLVLQIILFVITFIISFSVLYLSCVPIRFSSLLAYLWIPGIINFFAIADCDPNYNEYTRSSQKVILKGHLFLAILFILISSSIGIHKSFYNFVHPFDNFTIISKEYKDIPKIDSTSILKEAKLTSEAQLDSPIFRNGKWIYPVISTNSNVTSAGYIIVNSDYSKITFEKKKINCAPWMTTKSNSKLVARNFMPNVVFFGEQTYQIDTSGNVIFCQFYGDYKHLRAGRILRGAILINSETGECKNYEISSLPYWITGISF